MPDLKKIEAKLYAKMLDFISYSFRTEKEIRDRLNFYIKKMVFHSVDDREIVADKIISDLKNSGYINDEEYVKRYFEGLLLSPKTKSPREASLFLYKKGVPESLSRKYLNSAGDVLEEKSLRTLVEKKTRTSKNLHNPVFRQKLVRYLISKGFDLEKVRAEVDRVVSLK